MADSLEHLPGYYEHSYTSEIDELPKDKRLSAKKLLKLREKKVKSWWHQEKVRQAENRHQMAIDEDFKDHIQWDEEDKAEMEELGQAALTFNEIHPAIEWICGTERRTRVDWRVLPRKKEHGEEAKIKTGVLKYVSDVNKLVWHRSRAFKQAVTAGLSWLEFGYDGDKGDFPLFADWESWRNVWHDSLAHDWITMRDHRYLHRMRILDLDIAQAMFPKHRGALKSAAESQGHGSYYNDAYNETQLFYTAHGMGSAFGARANSAQGDSHGRRSRVRLVETWYREPIDIKRVRGEGDLNGRIYDPEDEALAAMNEAGSLTLFDDVYMQMRVMIHIDEGKCLVDEASPYDHNRFPFVPLYAYIRNRDNAPYGVVRIQRDPQMDLNKRRSKILYLLSVKRVIMDEGAVRDMDKFEEEIARPDSIIEKRKKHDLEIIENNGVAKEHIDLTREDGAYIRQVSGVTGENLGLSTNATSGVAISRRQDQGTTVTAPLFDNLRLSVQLGGEIMLSLAEQFLTDEDEFRITGDQNSFDFININKQQEDGNYENDITANSADFIVDESDYRESQRIAMFEQVGEMLSQMDSQIAMQLLDLWVDMSDMPQRAEFVARIRKINGQVDPESETDEEREAREEAEALAKQEEQDLQKQAIMLDFEEKAAKIDKTRKDSAAQYVKALKEAIEAAEMTVQAPILAELADYMIQEGLEPAKPEQQEQPMQQPLQEPMQDVEPNL